MGETVRLTTAQALVRFLTAQVIRDAEGREMPWVRGMLGIFGHGNLTGLGQALWSERSLEFVQGHSEQGMVHTAVAYARQLRRRRIWAVTTSIGPGATNLVTGAALATINRIPVLLLPGEGFASRRPDPVLQQLEDPQSRLATVNDTLRPVSRYFDRIERPEQLMSALEAAVSTLTDPACMGAVTLALPQDVQCEAFDFPAGFFRRRVHALDSRSPSSRDVARAVEGVSGLRRPFLVVGGGVRYSGREAEEELDRFVRTFRVPFGETQAGKGIIPSNHPWNAGAVGATGTAMANWLAREADGILAVGTRFSDFTTASKTAFGPDVPVVHVNVNRQDARKLGGIPVAADAGTTLAALRQGLAERQYRSEWDEPELRARRDAWEAEVARLLTADSPEPGTMAQTRILGELALCLPKDAVIVNAAGSLPGDLHRLWPVRQPGGYHLEYGYSCMGYEVAGALGVKLAEPDRPVFALVGDGSFLMLHSELVTAIGLGVKITVVVFRNGAYGSIHALQREHGMAAFGNEFRRQVPGEGPAGERLPVDYAKIAEGIGALGLRASTPGQLREALARAQAADRAALIDVATALDTQTHGYDSFWYVPTAEVGAGSDAARVRAADLARLATART